MSFYRVVKTLLVSSLLFMVFTQSVYALPVFPGAEGFGTDTPAGRGGKVYKVTSLADSGTGTLRAAVEASGPRTVLFDVSGTIHLNSNINVRNPFVTIACQSAPTPGVQVEGGMLIIMTTDVLIRHCKFRVGDSSHPNALASDTDAITIGDYQNNRQVSRIVIDHSELVFGPDIGGAAVFNATDFTFSWSIIGAGLWHSEHAEANTPSMSHDMAMFLRESVHFSPSDSRYFWPTRGSLHHNIYLHAFDRFPRIQGSEKIDFINNLLYNGPSWQGHLKAGTRGLNVVGNMHIHGPDNRHRDWCAVALHGPNWIPDSSATFAIYISDIKSEGNTGCPSNVMVAGYGWSSSMLKSQPTFPISISSIFPASQVESKLTGHAGPTRPTIDSLTQKWYNDVSNRTGSFINGINFDGVDGYPKYTNLLPNLSGGTPQPDSDNDGMPNAWENQYSFNPNSSYDGSSDADGDGYTNLEEYLNNTNPRGGGTVPTNTPVPTSPPGVPGDANNDGVVDINDYVIWLNNYNQSKQGSQFGDFNNSGKVDGIDYTIWLNNYGS
jgi:hypothetical protein